MSKHVDRVAAAIEADLDLLVDAMMAAYRSQIPSYATTDRTLLADVREGARASVEAGLARLRGAEALGHLDATLAAVGRRRAEQGVPLPDVLLAYQVGASVFWEFLVERAPVATAARVEVVVEGTRTMLDVLRHAARAVPAGYLEVAEGRVADEAHDRQVLVEALAGVRSDPHLAERAARLGVDVGGLAWCLAFAADEEQAGAQVRAVRRTFPSSVAGRVGDAVIAYLPHDRAPLPADLTALGIGAGLGLAAAPDTASAARRARAAASVALRLGRPVLRWETVMPLAAAIDGPEDDLRAFLDAHLGPVLRDPRAEELLRSLAAWYAAGLSLAEASRRLHVHRHTLEYRLGRLHDLLGIDLRDPLERLLLELALTLRD